MPALGPQSRARDFTEFSMSCSFENLCYFVFIWILPKHHWHHWHLLFTSQGAHPGNCRAGLHRPIVFPFIVKSHHTSYDCVSVWRQPLAWKSNTSPALLTCLEHFVHPLPSTFVSTLMQLFAHTPWEVLCAIMHDCVPDPLFLCFVFSKVVFCTRCNPCQLIMASLLFLSGPLLNGLCLSQQRNSLNVSAQWHFERLWHERNLEQYGAISFRCCKIIWKDLERSWTNWKISAAQIVWKISGALEADLDRREKILQVRKNPAELSS